MKIWGQLKKACFEILAVDPAQGVMGRVWFNSASKQVKYDDGTTIQTLQTLGASSGGSPAWFPNGNAALENIDTGLNKTFVFMQGQLQQLFASVKVPAGYSPGRQVKLVIECYSAENTASKVLLAALTTLIRPTTDVYDSVANQHSSVTLASSLSNLTTNKPFKIELDLTDANGLINGVAVQPNHILQLKLFRQNSATAPQLEVFTDSAQELSALASMELVF